MTPALQLLQIPVQEKPRLSTQCERILRELEYRKSMVESGHMGPAFAWCPLPVILSLQIASHTRRIYELRQAGYVIEMRNEWQGRQRRTAYRLVARPEGE